MKKSFTLILIVFLVLLTQHVFTAGQKGGEGKITIRTLHIAGGGVDVWEAINEDFMKEYPNIIVEQEIVQPGQLSQKLGGYVSTGKGPDLATMEAGTNTFMYRPVLMDLNGLFDDILPDITGLDIYYDDFDPNKALLAIPVATNGYMVYYNKQIFKEAGLDPEKPPENWTEMDAAVKAVKAIGKEGIALGAREYGVYWLAGALMHQTMTAQEQADAYTGKQVWTEGARLNFVKALDAIQQRGWVCEDAGSMTVTPAAQDMFVNGEAAFFVSLIGDAFNWKVWGDAMGYENVGAMRFPELRAGDIPGVTPSPLAKTIPLWGNYAFGIMKWSPNPDEAVTYLKYLLRPEVQKRLLLEGGFFPNNLKELGPEAVEYEIFGTLHKWAQEAVAIPGLFYWSPGEWDAFIRNCQMLYSNMTTVQKFAENMKKVQDQN